MEVPMETDSHLSTLKAMTSRHCILEQIHNGIRDKRDLHENLNTSRTTIDRAVRELEEENILHRREGYCEFTRFGRLAYQEFCKTSQIFETLSNANELLSILPEESDLNINLLQDANVKLADQRAPVAPFRHFTPIPNSEQIQAMLPVLFPQHSSSCVRE
ncbi:GntR family transcriptional regulator [Halogeometricum borinquense]|uniref:GntR family transcriptional regulator n=1 Tax=Halogeometricum borinquense TaxID=60847 RepID=A0A482TMY2_9EURY|nr:GntR family transcriptional regulator [Halogeometricum borinquense]